MSGYLLTFEGPDKSGKSTIIKDLAIFLHDELRINCAFWREPGSTAIGEKIRDILHDRKNTKLSYKTEALLYQAARAQLVEEKIMPALENGQLVIVDRFRDSSIIYQGIGRNLGLDTIDELNDFSTDGLMPDLTILLDIDLETAKERSKNSGVEINRMDMQGADFDNIIRDSYLRLAKGNPRFRIVNTKDKNISEVCLEVRAVTVLELSMSGFIERTNKGKER